MHAAVPSTDRLLQQFLLKLSLQLYSKQIAHNPKRSRASQEILAILFPPQASLATHTKLQSYVGVQTIHTAQHSKQLGMIRIQTIHAATRHGHSQRISPARKSTAALARRRTSCGVTRSHDRHCIYARRSWKQVVSRAINIRVAGDSYCCSPACRMLGGKFEFQRAYNCNYQVTHGLSADAMEGDRDSLSGL